MSEFIVTNDELNNIANEIKQYKKQVQECIIELEHIKRELKYQKSFPSSLYSYMSSQNSSMQELQKKLDNMSKTLINIARMYKDTERQIINGEKSSNSIFDDLKNLGSSTYPFISGYLDKVIQKKSKSIFDFGLEKILLKTGTKSQYDSIKKKLNDAKIEKTKKTLYKTDNDDEFYKKGDTVVSKELLNNKASVSFFDGKYSTNGKAGEFNVSATVGKAEAHSLIEAGIYSYTKDSNGNTVKVFAPGVNAEVGASATALDISTDGRLGLGKDHNMLGVYGKGEVVVGKASAQGSGTIALIGENGEINPQANVNLELEAIAGEIKGSAGVSVLGIDAGVKGSLNVGVGAHANFGLKDGVLQVDVGASLGVGASVGFEVDFSGAIKAVKGKATSFMNMLNNIHI